MNQLFINLFLNEHKSICNIVTYKKNKVNWKKIKIFAKDDYVTKKLIYVIIKIFKLSNYILLLQIIIQNIIKNFQ